MKSSGFTLIEILLVCAVTMVIGVFLGSILVNNNGIFYKQSAIVAGGLSLNDATRTIDQYLRQSTGVAAGYPEDSPAYLSGAGTLVLKLPGIDASGDVLGNVYDYIVVRKDTVKENVLRLEIFPDDDLSSREQSSLVLTTILDSVEFIYLDKNGNTVAPVEAKVVQVNLQVLAGTGTSVSSRSASLSVTLRNAN